uniref:AT5g35560/MOK9_21 n=1 Tax=Arabidopsis thaliana TaxID=3702 RepID=Q94AB0_ARATH|nr:AT5g35560/MOK9_21 [Arabidopsis thaliana]AAN18159.1 At5g35560/MOK9_21 [Arabidopsis thaliana]
MAKNEEGSSSPSWGASFFMQTSEDVAMAFAAAASAINPPRPSVVFSSKDEGSDSPLERLQRQVSKAVKNFYETPKTKSVLYNPEVLTSQKRQWAKFQDHKPLKDPSRLFESVVVVGLHPNCDIQALERQYIARKSEGSSGRLRSALVSQNHSRVEPSLEPQVLLVYPPDKQPPIKYKDLHSFCFPGGIEVHAVERTPSMSELSEIILSQVADNSTLYGCCLLVEEIVNKPSRLLSTVLDKQPACSSLSRYVMTTRRCYCVLTRLPFFELHFGVLNSIFLEERLEHLMSGISCASLEPPTDFSNEDSLNDSSPQQRDSGDTKEQTVESLLTVSPKLMIPYQLLSKAEKVVYQSLAPFFGVLIWMRSLILALAFRLLHVRGGILGPVQMILRQMKHPFLVKMIQVVILISLSGQSPKKMGRCKYYVSITN